MEPETGLKPGGSVYKYLKGLQSDDLLLTLSWDEWLEVVPPFPEVPYTCEKVVQRFHRNGYDWDIHGTVWTPATEIDPSVAFVMSHGTNGSECNIDITPDGRPGLSRILVSQGFKVLTLTFPGHYGSGPEGEWLEPIEQRQLRYLDGPDLPAQEIKDRMLKCTFDTNVQGVGMLVDKYMAGRKIICTNGPLAGRLPLFMKKAKLIGVATLGFAGTDGWRKEWREKTGMDKNMHIYPIDGMERKSAEYHRGAGYENDRDLTPWGGADEYIEKISVKRSQLKSSLCVNQHYGIPEILEPYVERSGLPRGEFFDYLDSPDPKDLEDQSILLLVGEKDRRHWIDGDTLEVKWEYFMGMKYKESSPRVHVVLIPRHGHSASTELHNEKAIYLWLWAFKDKFFPQ